MTTVSARDASRGFSALLDRVENDGEEITIVRGGKVVARIVPDSAHTVGGFLARRADGPELDDGFADDAVSANRLLVVDAGDPWHD